MSTKIYDAFVTDLKIEEVTKKLVDERKFYLGKTYSHYINQIIREAIENYDSREEIPESSPYFEIKDSNFDDYIKIAHKELLKAEKENTFAPDARLVIYLYPYKRRVYIMLGGSYELINLFGEYNKEWLKDFSYWDNTDKPDSVTTRDWNKRKKIWNIIFDKYWSGYEAMLKYEINDKCSDLPYIGFLFRYCDKESVTIPSDIERKETYFFYDYVNKERSSYSEENGEFDYSKFHNLRNKLQKEIKDGLHDEEINKITVKPLDGNYINFLRDNEVKSS